MAEALIRRNRPLLRGCIIFGLNIRLKGYNQIGLGLGIIVFGLGLTRHVWSRPRSHCVEDSLTSLVISRYWTMSAFFKGVGHFNRKFQIEGDIAHQSLLVPEN